MIFVNQVQLEQVKYLIEQSTQGNHILFPAETIKLVASSAPLAKKRQEIAEKILEEMILCSSLEKKQRFLEGLDRQTYKDVAHVFINIVQNSAQDAQGLH
mgnify:CR=1 FL=1